MILFHHSGVLLDNKGILEETCTNSSQVGLLNLAVKLLGLGNPLLLGPSVLEPDLDLSVSDLELLGELCPLGDGEVTLGFVLLLQLVQLITGEGGPGLSVSFVFPQDRS